MRYEDAGVSVERGKEVVNFLKGLFGNKDIGPFASSLKLDDILKEYSSPSFIFSCDGVGTKILLHKKYHTMRYAAQDLVAMNANDIATVGAKPVVFFDYIGINKVLLSSDIKDFFAGLKYTLSSIGCKLGGGETAEMPDIYLDGTLDLAGFVVGVVDKGKQIGPQRVEIGDILVALSSSGIHSNGFSLVRKLLDNRLDPMQRLKSGENLIDVLLKPTRLYVNQTLHLSGNPYVHAAVHVTGGGFVENPPRAIPEGMEIVIDRQWEIPEIFGVIRKEAKMDEMEMMKTFNMGVGFIYLVAPEGVSKILKCLEDIGEKPFIIGEVKKAEGDHRIRFR